MPGANVILSAEPRLLRTCAVHYRVLHANRRSRLLQSCYAKRAPSPDAPGVVVLEQALHVRIVAARKPQAASCYTYTCTPRLSEGPLVVASCYCAGFEEDLWDGGCNVGRDERELL
jgi:hypothetical protein